MRHQYGTERITFRRDGGMDCTKSDIAVVKNGNVEFYIEVKSKTAQAGQFVLLVDEDSGTFVFSKRNHSKENKSVKEIIKYMNSDFAKFKNAGTAGVTLEMCPDVFASWVIDHYKEKNVRYVVCQRKCEYIIFPIQKMSEYFNITAKYRVKSSGPPSISQKDTLALKEKMLSLHSFAKCFMEDGKLYVVANGDLKRDEFLFEENTYYFSRQEDRGDNVYRVKRRSKTKNMNVIFSVKLKRSQNTLDLEEFERILRQ